MTTLLAPESQEQRKQIKSRIRLYQDSYIRSGKTLEQLEQNIKDNYTISYTLAVREYIQSMQCLAEIKKELYDDKRKHDNPST